MFTVKSHTLLYFYSAVQDHTVIQIFILFSLRSWRSLRDTIVAFTVKISGSIRRSSARSPLWFGYKTLPPAQIVRVDPQRSSPSIR
jgi:hypothetical protein